MKKFVHLFLVLTFLLTSCSFVAKPEICTESPVKNEKLFVLEGAFATELQGMVPAQMLEEVTSATLSKSMQPLMDAETLLSYEYFLNVEAVGASPLSGTETCILDKENRKYKVELPEGKYKITIVAKETVDVAGVSTQFTRLQGDQTIVIDSEGSVANESGIGTPGFIHLTRYSDASENGNLNISAKIYNVGPLEVQVILGNDKYTLTKTSEAENFATYSQNFTDLTPGTYDVCFQIWSNISTGLLLYSFTDVVTIYSNLTTDAWLNTTGVSYIQENKLVFSQAFMENCLSRSVFYVKEGLSNSNQREDDKIISKGDYYNPFDCITGAGNAIKELQKYSYNSSNPNRTYTIKYKGDVTLYNKHSHDKTDIYTAGIYNVVLRDFPDCKIIIKPYDKSSNRIYNESRFNNRDGFYIANAKCVEFKDILFTSNGYDEYMIVVASDAKVILNNCNFTGEYESGKKSYLSVRNYGDLTIDSCCFNNISYISEPKTSIISSTTINIQGACYFQDLILQNSTGDVGINISGPLSLAEGFSDFGSLDMKAAYPTAIYSSEDSATYKQVLTADNPADLVANYKLFKLLDNFSSLNEEGRIIYRPPMGGLDFVSDNITVEFSTATVSSTEETKIDIKVYQDKGLPTEKDITGTSSVYSVTIKAYYLGNDITNSPYFTKKTIGEYYLQVHPGLPVGTVFQLYVDVTYGADENNSDKRKSYGGSFDITVN